MYKNPREMPVMRRAISFIKAYVERMLRIPSPIRLPGPMGLKSGLTYVREL